MDGGRWRIERDDSARVKGTQSTVGHGKDFEFDSEWVSKHWEVLNKEMSSLMYSFKGSLSFL